jgi:hypothetical protein
MKRCIIGREDKTTYILNRVVRTAVSYIFCTFKISERRPDTGIEVSLPP